MSRLPHNTTPSSEGGKKRRRRARGSYSLLLPTAALPPDANDDGSIFMCVAIADGMDDDEAETRRDSVAANGKARRQKNSPPLPSASSRLQRFSSLASWLCLVDCTLLPAVTFLLPLLGFANLGPDRLEGLHLLGHFATVYFLLPVGCLSAVTNYLVHRERAILGLACLGLFLVTVANSYSLPLFLGGGHFAFFHVFHRGLCHRVVNLSGCSCLLTSNHLSHKRIARLDDAASCCVMHQSVQPRKHRRNECSSLLAAAVTPSVARYCSKRRSPESEV